MVGVEAWDGVGNGPTVVTWDFRIDATLPVVDITSPTGDPVIEGGSVTVTWTGSDVPSGIDHYEVALDDGWPVDVGTATTYSFHALPPGVHSFEVDAYDVAGNSNSAPRRATATVPTPPIGNTTNYNYAGVAAEPLPAWAIVLIMINAVEAAAIAWVVLRQRRRPPEALPPTQEGTVPPQP